MMILREYQSKGVALYVGNHLGRYLRRCGDHTWGNTTKQMCQKRQNFLQNAMIYTPELCGGRAWRHTTQGQENTKHWTYLHHIYNFLKSNNLLFYWNNIKIHSISSRVLKSNGIFKSSIHMDYLEAKHFFHFLTVVSPSDSKRRVPATCYFISLHFFAESNYNKHLVFPKQG